MSKLRLWLADQIWGALKIVARKLAWWLTDAKRHYRRRKWHRDIWWHYQARALKTADELDDRIALSWKIECGFHDPPPDADPGDVTKFYNGRLPGKDSAWVRVPHPDDRNGYLYRLAT